MWIGIGGFTIVLVVIVLDIILNKMEESNGKLDKNYESKKAIEAKRLKTRRIFYGVSWLLLCVLAGVFDILFDLRNKNEKLFNAFISLLFIYGGLGGLYSKMFLFKLPIEDDGKLGIIFNIFLP